MSKEADKDLAEQPAAKGKGRRRRRKGGGLRIPSDNVPRSADSSDGDVSAPVPADPNLAVSVAYAFGAEDSSVNRQLGPGDDDPASHKQLGPGDDDPASHKQLGPAPAAEGTDPVVPAPSVDPLDDTKTREMPAVQLEALGLSESMVSAEPDESAADQSGADGAGSSDAAPTSHRSGDSVDIPFDDEELPEEMATIGAAEPARVQRAATVALSDEDLEELMEPLEDARREVAATPALPTDEQALARGEMDGRSTEPLAAIRDDTGAEPAKSASTDAAEDVTPVDDDDFEELPAVAAAESVAEAASGADAAPDAAPPAPPPEPGVPAAVAALEKSMAESSPEPAAVEPADPGDSGEIITDDLIEEVDDGMEAVPPPMPAVPPPAPATTERATPPPPKKSPPPAPKGGGARAAAVAAAAAPARPRRRKGKPWFEELFDEDYLRTLPFLTPQATQAEALFVEGALEIETGAQVLDVGCGYGRHAMELAARGYHVVALDSSLPLLLRGADEAQRRSLNINFVHGDMRELTFESQFDGAYCLFSTFGYFDDETNKKAAQNIARALKPGARLIIAVLNRDYLIEDLPSRVWWEGDGCVVLEEVEFNYFSSRIISNRSVVFDDGRQLEQEISMRAYSLHEFGKLLHAAGFRVLEVSGSMVTRGRFFGNHSREIIVVAERRGESPGRAATNAE